MGRMVLQSPMNDNMTIYITLAVRTNYGNAEANGGVYTDITEVLKDKFECEVCGSWHLNPDICGMDTMTLAEVEDVEDPDKEV